MNYNKAVIFSYLLISTGNFIWRPSWVTAAVAVVGLLAFMASEVFGFYESAVKRMSWNADKVLQNNNVNEERIKQLTEAGMKMGAAIQELEARMTLEGVGRFAGIKR